MDLPGVSVVIPSFNRRAALGMALPPLLADSQTCEIIVVLDGSTDDSAGMLDDLAASDARVRSIALGGNSGRSVARHIGVDAAHGDVVLLLDDDVVAEPTMVSGHAMVHAMGPALVVVGYMPVEVSTHDDAVTRIYAAEYESAVRRYEADPDSILAGLWGGNISLRREDCLRVGLLSPGFENRYHEDTDFGLRCQAAGLTGVFDRTLRAKHHHRRAVDGFLADAESQGAGAALLQQRHRGARLPTVNNVPAWLSKPAVISAVDRALVPLVGVHPKLATPTLRFLRRLHQSVGAHSIASGQ